MKVSVLINYYNRQPILRRCLWSIYHFTAPIDDFEVIVIDDQSADDQRAEQVAEEFYDKLPLKVVNRRVKTGKNPGMPLNIGAQASTGDILILNDPDFLHMTPIVNQMAANFMYGNSQFIITSCYSISQQKLKIIEATDFSDPKSLIQLRDRIDKIPAGIRIEGDDAWNCHPLYRPNGLGAIRAVLREDFFRLGGFDEDFHEYFGFEDTDLLRRVNMAGIHTCMATDMLCYHHWHYDPTDVEEVENRRLGYLHNRVVFQKKVELGNVLANQGRTWGDA